LYELKYRPY